MGLPASIDHASRMNWACVQASGVADRVPRPRPLAERRHVVPDLLGQHQPVVGRVRDRAQTAPGIAACEQLVLAALAAQQRLRAATLTKAYLARIARTNTAGASINAVRIVNRHALDQARALDRERARGRVRGAMHGIPVLVKDNIDVRGMPTTAGAVALEHSYPRDDSPSSRRGGGPGRSSSAKPT